MKNAKMSTIVVLALGLMVWSAPMVYAAQYLTVNGQDVTSITLELGQSRTVEVVSTDSTSYTAYLGFDNGVVLGDFSHLETKPEAGNLATVADYNQPAFYGYYLIAAGSAPPPSAGVHFVFQYETQELGTTDVKLYDGALTSVTDSVQVTVIRPTMGTAFSYQGRLMDDNEPAEGLYDFLFKLYDYKSDGSQLASTIDINDLDVIDGQFAVTLDFGSGIFDGNAVWLETTVAQGDGNDPCTLKPRVELTPTPYALYAKTAHPGHSLDAADGSPTDSVYVDDNGNVGIGTTTPRASLEVNNSGSSHAIWASTSYIPVYAHRTSTGGTWPAVNGDCNSESSGASGVRGRILSTSPGSLGAGVYGYNYGTGSNGVGVRGYHDGAGAGVYGRCDIYPGKGVYGESSGGYGVYGKNSSGCYGYLGGWQVGVHGRYYTGNNYGYIGGPEYGVYGYSKSDRGVRGEAGSTGTGVYGASSSGTGVYGYSSSGYAGYFQGKVHITGTLSKGGGSFKIDHPLEPENKYLQHSFIESPDMMNVYNGNVLLDEKGEACVQLPEYFEALNRDFRYQLTAIGTPAPNLYIAEEISDNHFKIAGGKKGTKVSWQVTGIRQDAYARANRIVVEENKPAEEHGYYLHPAAYGLPEEKGIEAVHNARFPETRQIAKKVD